MQALHLPTSYRIFRGSSIRASLAVGIDFGTSNSVVAVTQNGKTQVLNNTAGSLTTPSLVSYLENGDVVVGRQARRSAAQQKGTVFSSVKRLMGKRYSEVQGQNYGFELEEGDGGEVWLRCPSVEDGWLRPEDVAGEMIKALLMTVKDAYGEDVDRCVLSVPAYFDEVQRLSSGLEHVRLIQEPVASALAYGVDLNRDQTVCVFDLGGGTLDICLLELGKGITEILATGGDAELGGDDIDAAIVKWLMKEHLAYVPRLRKTAKFLSKLKQLAEAAKIQLSSGTDVLMKFLRSSHLSQCLIRIPVMGDTVEVRLSRQQLEKLCKPLFVEMRSAFDRCCWQAGVDLMSLKNIQNRTQQPMEIRARSRSPVSEILLVGAATKMPAVGRFLENMTRLNIRKTNIDPDTCVAVGAAIEAGRLDGQLSEEFMMMDVWQASLMRALAEEQLKDI